jgi:citrate lyase subunit beta/citryl-CoA lyase
MFRKAVKSHADAVVLDLEDSVLPVNKSLAYKSIHSFLNSAPESSLWLRLESPLTEPDQQECGLIGHRAIRGIVIPKVDSADRVARIREIWGKSTSLVVLIESARALHRSHAIAMAAGVSCLALGSVDFLSDVGGTSHELVTHALITLVLASRVAEISRPIAGVTVDIANRAGLENDIKVALSLGCFGKLCIHPSQVALVNSLHQPTAEKIAWARAVITKGANRGTFLYEGKMIDAAVLREAQLILHLAHRAPNVWSWCNE